MTRNLKLSATIIPPERTYWIRHPAVLWGAFIVIHAWLGWLALTAPGDPLYDVIHVYFYWVQHAIAGDFVVGIDTVWVYPILAFVPMLLAAIPGMSTYVVSWLVLVTLVNAVAFWVLIGGGHIPVRHVYAAWWWLVLLLALGPVALGRIDSIATAVTLIGLLFVLSRPGLSGGLLAVAAWIKIWPALLLAAAVVVLRRRLRITVAALITSVVVASIALMLGSGRNVLSFLILQISRGVQIEASVAMPYLWLAAAHVPGFDIYFNQDFITNQVLGTGVQIVAVGLLILLMLIAGLLLLLGFDLVHRGVSGPTVLAPLALALTAALIAFNKVGSPQFVGWLAAPIVLGLVLDRTRFRVPAMLVLVIALLTQLIYPFFYESLLHHEPETVLLLTVRNLLEFILLGWAVWRLMFLRRRETIDSSHISTVE
jgi:hypothetical protein